MIKKRIIVFAIVAGVLVLYKHYQESDEKIVNKKEPIPLNKNYKRQPASIKKLNRKKLHSDQIRFNQLYPPPQTNRTVAALIDQFDNFDQVKESYKIHDHRLQIGNVTLHESDYLTHPDDGSFDESLGEIVKTINGYLVYSPNQKTAHANNNHLYVDQLTWQPTIITGKLFVKYPEGEASRVSSKIKELGHQITFHHENIRRYEVQVQDRKKTDHYKREIASQVPGAQVDLELKSYERSH